jgi:hypothetical protein
MESGLSQAVTAPIAKKIARFANFTRSDVRVAAEAAGRILTLPPSPSSLNGERETV